MCACPPDHLAALVLNRVAVRAKKLPPGYCSDRPSSGLARTLWVGLVCRWELFFETAAIGRAMKRVEFSVERGEKAKPAAKGASRARLDDQLARQLRIVEIDPDGDIAVRSRRGPAPSTAVIDHDLTVTVRMRGRAGENPGSRAAGPRSPDRGREATALPPRER